MNPDVQAALDTLRSHRPEVGDYEAEFDAALDVLVRKLERLEAHKDGALVYAEKCVAEADAERARADEWEQTARAESDGLMRMREERDAERARADRLAEGLRRLLALYESRTMSEYERAEFVAIRDLLAEHGSPEEARP
jgi:hypothetical protein